MKSSKLENLFQPASEGGQGYKRFSDIIKPRKRTSLNRVLHSADNWSRLVADALVREVTDFRITFSSQPAITPQMVRPGRWVTSLIEYGWKVNACIPKQVSLPVKRACPSLHQSLASPLPGHTWPPSNLKCLHSFHLATFGDLVHWDRARSFWSWREGNWLQAL